MTDVAVALEYYCAVASVLRVPQENLSCYFSPKVTSAIKC